MFSYIISSTSMQYNNKKRITSLARAHDLDRSVLIMLGHLPWLFMGVEVLR